jgi:eukaryotic-like serine/threonine-protein kinase
MAMRLLLVAVFLISVGVVFWFAMVHTLHLGTLAVPDLRGIPVAEAERRGHDLGLSVENEAPGVFSASFPAGVVAAQEPYPGFHVKTGATIRVRLSRGNERLLVPDLHGQSLQAAEVGLEQAGLKVGRAARVHGELDGEAVVATDPASGSEVPPAAEVTLLINATPARQLWVMPSLLRRPLEEVRGFCLEHRLRLGQAHEVAYPGLGSGIVLRQYPPAGSQLSRSDIITVWVSR